MTNSNIEKSRYTPTRRALIFWCLFIGVGALGGGVCMLIDPTGGIMGMDVLLPYFKPLPFSDVLFQNYLFAGCALIVVNGLTNLLAAALLLKKKRSGAVLGTLWGVTLMLWICIQFYIFPANFMDTIYFIFGAAQFVTGLMCLVFSRQESFSTDPSNYKNIGKKGDALVLYFSRLGYTQRVAYELADKLGADIERITARERTGGTLGFWWCGRFAMHRWPMAIEPLEREPEKYEKVYICSPVWAFGLSAPVRALCGALKGRLSRAAYVLVHFNPSLPAAVADEMDALLGLKRESVTSVQSNWGKQKRRWYSDGKGKKQV